MRATAFLAIAILSAASAVAAAPTVLPQSIPATRIARVVLPARRTLTTVSASAFDVGDARAPSLAPVAVKNNNTKTHGTIRFYDDEGVLDRGAARAFMRIAGSNTSAPEDASDDDERLALRVVQLAIRASYHFGGAPILIISATRPGSHGKHATGEALDFSLEGVRASVLAAHLRKTPRAGVGIYTHRKTQYVHLDVREHSYHWLDASPPGVKWRERVLPDRKQAVRDASWSAALDLPEVPSPSR